MGDAGHPAPAVPGERQPCTDLRRSAYFRARPLNSRLGGQTDAMDMQQPLPEPEPADTARLDQLAATWRDLPPDARATVEGAAAQLRTTITEAGTTSQGAAARLIAALTDVGLNAPET